MKQNKTAIFFIIFLTCTLIATTVLSIFVGPILLGFLVSYLLNPSFVHLERKGISRNTSAIVSIVLIILLISTAVWIVLPIVITQIETIVAHIPDFKNFLNQKIGPKIEHFIGMFGGTVPQNWSLHSIFPFDYQKISSTLFQSLGESTRFVLFSLLFIVATPFSMFMFMKHLPHFYSYINTLVPPSIRDSVDDFFKEVDVKLRAVLRGQVLVVLIMSILYPIAFLIAGLPTAIAIGVLVGLARVVSGLDTLVAVTLGSIVIIANGSSYQVIFGSIAAFLTLQALDMFLINPRVMGKYAELHPLLILMSVILFGYWFGFYGVLIAIPSVTILKVASQKLLIGYKRTSFFKK